MIETKRNTEIANIVPENGPTSHSMYKKISIFLIDDSKAFLGVAARFLSVYDHISIEGSSTSARQGIDEIERIKPDLVVMDLVMPELNGLEATRWIKRHMSATRVIIVSLHDQQEYRASAEAVGADGFLTKTDFANKIIGTINTIFEDAN